jgi:exopolysaccharide production protein ExoZ
MYFSSLQILRGLSALAVVLFHMRHYLPPGNGQTMTVFRFFTNPFSLGVFYFFVLSGFLMTYLIDNGYKKFLLRRIARIYPTYLLVVIVVILIRLLVFGSVEAPHLLQALTLLPLTSNNNPVSYQLGVEWTLVYEVFFYLVCSLFANERTKHLFVGFAVVWGISIILVNKCSIIGNHFTAIVPLMLPSWKWILFSPMNLLFIAGILAYVAYLRIGRLGRWTLIGVSGLAMMLFYVAILFGSHNLSGVILICIAIGIIVAVVSCVDRDAHRGSSAKLLNIMVRFGDYSYAIYLVHVPIISGLVAYSTGKDDVVNLGSNALGFLVLGFVLVFGWYCGRVDLLLHTAIRRKIVP